MAMSLQKKHPETSPPMPNLLWCVSCIVLGKAVLAKLESVLDTTTHRHLRWSGIRWGNAKATVHCKHLSRCMCSIWQYLSRLLLSKGQIRIWNVSFVSHMQEEWKNSSTQIRNQQKSVRKGTPNLSNMNRTNTTWFLIILEQWFLTSSKFPV